MANKRGRPIGEAKVARVLLANAEYVLNEWLPGGQVEGREFSARNPTRADSQPGSFKVNLDLVNPKA